MRFYCPSQGSRSNPSENANWRYEWVNGFEKDIFHVPMNNYAHLKPHKTCTMSFSHCRLETGRLQEEATGGHWGTGETRQSLLEAQE